MTNYQITGLVLIIFALWFAFEIYRAPMMDESGKVTKPGKKLRDLWRKRQ
jgi:hypothetical protein